MLRQDQRAGPLSREQLADLRRKLVDHFNDEELRTLCFDLEADYENLPAQGKEGKARELIAYLQRQGRLSDLMAACRQARPKVAWTDLHDGRPEDRDDQPPAGFLPIGRWQMQVSDSSAWLIDFYPNGAFAGQGIGPWWGAGAQASGGWSFFIPTQTLQLQGAVNNLLPIMIVMVIQGQQNNAYRGLGNDGKGYSFTRA